MSNRNREPFINAYYQVSIHLGTWFQRRQFFRNRPKEKGQKDTHKKRHTQNNSDYVT
jgi:hypothetical protein